MKEFKSIITHPEGQNLFPGQITTIEGYPHGTSVTMQNTKPQIALTPYGASYMMPNMDYKFAGNTVVELPMAQMGGQDQQQQLMEMIQVYAQMKGMKPEELIQKLQSLPKEQQQQAVQSIAQEVQQAMAQQQEAQMAQQQQEGMMGQQQEMGMAEMGGEPCIECFDKYNPSPQAQDLNWFYKAQGGEAFPQANTYPEDWASYHGNQYQKEGQTGKKSFIDKAEEESLKLVPSLLFDGNAPRQDIDWPSIGNSIGRNLNTFMKTSPLGMLFSTHVTVSNPSEEYGPQVEQRLKDGGEAFPQAQTYLPYDRAGETRPNFMFETGGQSNIEDVYRIMKKGGVDYNPSKKKGGKFDHVKEFQKYLEKGGGLKKYQAWMSQTGNTWQHSDTPISTFALPESMRENAAYNAYLNSNPMASRDAFYGSNTATNAQGYDYSFNPGSVADPNYGTFTSEGNYQAPMYDQNIPAKKKEDKGWKFNFQRAEKDVAGLGQIADYIRKYKERNSDGADKERRNRYTSEFMPVAQFGGGQYGDWSTNATQGTSFRPNEMVYAQKLGRPYEDINVYDYNDYSLKKGGSILDRYNEDDEYDLTEEEIRQIVAAGGTIEYL